MTNVVNMYRASDDVLLATEDAPSDGTYTPASIFDLSALDAVDVYFEMETAPTAVYTTPAVGPTFDPLTTWASGEDGAFYDHEVTASLWQKGLAGTNIGRIPVDVDGNLIGIRLDTKHGLTYDADVTNGNFASGGTAWTDQINWSFSGGQAHTSSTGHILAQNSPVTLAVGDIVEVTFTITSFTSGAVHAWVAGYVNNALTVFSTVGTHTLLVPVGTVTNQRVGLVSGSTPVASVDNVSVRRVKGRHGYQPTDGSRPVWQADASGVVPAYLDTTGSKSIPTVFPNLGTNCTVMRAFHGGTIQILTGQTISGTWAGNTTAVVEAIVDRALTSEETANWTAYLTMRATSSTLDTSSWLLVENYERFSPSAYYEAFGFAVECADEDILFIARRGADHVEQTGDVHGWRYNGTSWSNASLYNSAYDDRCGGGGVTSTGTIIAAFGRYNAAAPAWLDLGLIRSTNDGVTWSSYIPVATLGHEAYLPYGPLVNFPSGKIGQTFYGEDTGDYRVWMSFSEDDGVTWGDEVDIEHETVSPRPNEMAVVWISGADDATSKLVGVSRNESGGMLQYTSSDGGQTWSAPRSLWWSVNPNDVSPWLYLDGDVLRLVYADRNTGQMKHCWGNAAAIYASTSAWHGPQVIYDSAATVWEDFGYPTLLRHSDGKLRLLFYDAIGTGVPNLYYGEASL